MSHARLLVVEDNERLRRAVVSALRDFGYAVDEDREGEGAIERLADPAVEPYDVVVSDLRLPGVDGLQVLRAARERTPRTAVLIMSAHGTVESAVSAMKLGAFDFVEKPVSIEHLEVRVSKAVEHAHMARELSAFREERAARYAPENIVGSSPALAAAVELVERVAPTRATLLVTGETGTGKELIAGLAHALSPRCEGPFIKVNCAALPDALLESELFGHERGAYTGADRQRLGHFEAANSGTLLLDEIGEMSLTTQAKLLRVLQDQEFHRLGGNQVIRTDVRIVAATNRDLSRAIAQGEFREDLYFRLNVISVHLPPLRERPEDATALAHYFLDYFSREFGASVAGFTDAALARIRQHPWPGNARELRNAVERAVILAAGRAIDAEHIVLSTGMVDAASAAWPERLPPEGMALRDMEQKLVREALSRTGFVQKDAAALLGVSRRQLNYMVQKMGITHPSWRRNREPKGSDREELA